MFKGTDFYNEMKEVDKIIKIKETDSEQLKVQKKKVKVLSMIAKLIKDVRQTINKKINNIEIKKGNDNVI